MPLSEIARDLHFAVRQWRRRPGFLALVVFVLAVGIGGNAAVFSLINAVLLRPLPYSEPDRLYELAEAPVQGEPSGIPIARMETYESQVPGVEKVALFHWENETITGPEGPENLYGERVSPGGLEILGVKPRSGRWFSQEDYRANTPRVVILSHKLWQRRYASDAGVVGRGILMNGIPHTVIGVMPPDFYYPSPVHEFWTPWVFTAESGDPESRYNALARLRPGVGVTEVQGAADRALRSVAPAVAARGWTVKLRPVGSRQTREVRGILLTLLGAVGFVFLIACLNVANLQLARAMERGREMAVRSALGASGWRLTRQLLVESVVMALLGGVTGLAVAAGLSRGLVASFSGLPVVPRLDQARLDGSVICFTVLISLIAAIVCGVVPAWRAARANVNEDLKQGGRGSSRRVRCVRNVLVLAETALSLVLLTGAGLMLRSLNHLLSMDPGFRPDHVLTLRVPPPPELKETKEQTANLDRLMEGIQSIPGVRAAGVISPLPLSNVEANGTFYPEGQVDVPKEEMQLVRILTVSPGYFPAMGITVRRGRVFGEGDGPDAQKVIVINEAAARRFFPNQDPIGRRVSMVRDPKPDQWLIVCGVVSDVRHASLTREADPAMYCGYRQHFFAAFAATLTVRTSGDPHAMAAAIQKVIRVVNADQPVLDVRTMPEIILRSVSQPRFYSVLLVAFALIAVLLAAAGLYGVLSGAVQSRTREIGIRMALGADRVAIIGRVAWSAMVWVGSGMVLGLAGSWWLMRLLQAQLYGVKPVDLITYTASATLLVLVALCASWVPARRAASVEPVIALRTE
jgi:predicted permease